MHHDLWDATLMDRRSAFFGEIDLVRLRDRPDGGWNVDTLYILTDPQRLEPLLALASTWSADDPGALEGEKLDILLGARTLDACALRLWWD